MFIFIFRKKPNHLLEIYSKYCNRYIPYASDRYKGKTYIYMEGDSSGDEKYAFMSDTTDVTSSESEYEELDINDIYVPGSPKYKTLIEVVLEPSKRDTQNDIHNDIPSDIPNTPSDTPPPITDDEWNQLKKDFISNMLQNTQNTEPNILHDNVDNNTHPTMSRHKVDQKPFIMSIHDRNLYIGEEYSYDMSTNSGQNNVYSGIDPTSANHDSYSDKNDPISDNHHPYSGIDLINDVLNGDYDIYDEILKRKENELFGTYHTKKNTSTNSVAKNTNSDPILNQINLFHKWLDRHRYMCAKLKNKEDILNKLKEEWNKENNNNSAKTYNSDNKSSHNHVLNTDVSIQIDMNNPKPKNEFTNMDTSPDKSTIDTILDDLEKYNEPYYYDFYKDDIIYHDVDVEKSSMDDIYVDHNNVTSNNMDVPTKMHIEMNIVNNKKKIFEEEYPISDIWNI
ncbi:variant-specific surface protein [Plasmodium falciparum IGH-CR14]|uniref:Variant-specific surface protein n=1 Tax=Plasmodium falciparum IGH-CR14 TaxID=580059 RepID=A0A0L1I3U9_PLAFA|nr:variant-specific surface protein [Plasmodium falciparum IGH-CR14]